jgi:uroporphyrinogen decarboxylase
VGVDTMNQVQTSAKGMVPAKIKQEFGRDLAFSGAIDVQQLLPNATRAQVKDEAKKILDAIGTGGGFIPGPVHNIQLGTPPENVIAMYEAMDEYIYFFLNSSFIFSKGAHETQRTRTNGIEPRRT